MTTATIPSLPMVGVQSIALALYQNLKLLGRLGALHRSAIVQRFVGGQCFQVLKHQHVADHSSSAPCLSSACVRAINEPPELCEGLELPLCFMSLQQSFPHTASAGQGDRSLLDGSRVSVYG